MRQCVTLNLQRVLLSVPQTSLARTCCQRTSRQWIRRSFARASWSNEGGNENYGERLSEERRSTSSRLLPEIGSVDQADLASEKEAKVETELKIASLLERDEIDHAEEKLQELEADVSVVLRNRFLAAYAKFGLVDRLQSLLAEMELSPDTVDVVSYNTCLDVLGPPEAHKLLRKMMENRLVDKWSFNTVISAWAKVGDANRAANVLHEQHAYHQRTGDPSVKPDRIGVSAVIAVLGRKGKAKEAEQLLRAMQQSSDFQPDALTMTSVIHAHSKSKDPNAVENALAILKEMEESDDERMQPDIVTKNVVLALIAKKPNCGEDVEAIFRKYNSSADPRSRPTEVTWATVMLAWKNTEGGAERAYNLLEEMKASKDVQPNNVCYSTVMSAFAREGKAQEAEQLLEQMHGSPYLEPNSIAYTSVMEAWANSGDRHGVEAAWRLLRTMDTLAQQTNHGMLPTAFTFHTLIKAIEKCPCPHKGFQAVHVVETMTMPGRLPVPPTTRTFNAVLNAISATTEKDPNSRLAALDLIVQTLHNVRRGTRADAYTYPAAMKAVANLSEDGTIDNNRTLELVFNLCKGDGWVDAMVLSHMRRACSPSHFRSLLEGNEAETDLVDLLPKSWVRKRARTRRRRH